MPFLLTALLLVWLSGLLIAWAMCRMTAEAERHAVTRKSRRAILHR